MMAQFLSSTTELIHGFFYWTVPFLLVLGAVVIVHEFGHFLAGRALGITVETFSIGFGPEIASFHDKRGTRWRLAWIPLGGYVRFKGDENVASLPTAEDLEKLTPGEREGNLHTAPLWRRVLIVLAGPFTNFLLGFAIYMGIALVTGIAYQQAEIICVEDGMPGAKAGLQAGDKVVSVGGRPVRSFEDFSSYVVMNARSPIDIAVERGGKVVNLTATPELTEKECVGRLGVVGSTKTANAQIVNATLFEAAGEGLHQTWRVMKLPVQFFGQLFRGNACVSSLGGPVKIAEIAKTVAQKGFIYLIPLIAYLSVGVGVFNLLPIPVLDGGHLLFYGAEAILGRPLNQKAQEAGFQFGFVLLLMLFVLITGYNIVELWPGNPSASQPAAGQQASKCLPK